MTRPFSTFWIAAATCLSLAGCGGSGDDDPDPPPTATDPFAQVDATAKAAYQTLHLDGMGLAIYDRTGTKVFERMYGDFSPNRRVAIASASKMVSGVTLFRLIDQGYLTLDTTVGAVLGWSGDNGGINLRELLSFTSGLPSENRCTYQFTYTLASCVAEIEQSQLTAEPGTRFDYGSTHLAVAGRMAEVLTGKPWNQIFAETLRDPLGLPSDITYYSNPLQATGTDNPLLAGGLRMSMNEYERVLHFTFDKGVWQGSALLPPTLFDAQTVTPYPNAVIGHSPAEGGLRYGLTAWLECSTPQTGCTTISSPGAFGFTPWLDRSAGYYAILGMEYANNSDTHFGASLQQQLKPLIVEALARR